jgi:hypothetical protein
MKKLFLFFAAFTTGTFFFSCQKDNTASPEEIEQFTVTSIQNLEATTRTGKGGCFELVFPVTVGFAGNKTAEVNSYDELKTAIRTWIKENSKPGKSLSRPHFIYPFDVITDEGETVTVESISELIALRKECKNVSTGLGSPCFKLNYPITIIYPDNSLITFSSALEMRKAIRAWKSNNTNSIYRPILSYPITITMEDGSFATINSKEEFRKMKQGCK